jgi:pilus assembly protein CpaF
MTAVPEKAAQKAENRQAANDSTALTHAEKEWKHKIHQRLLQVMDLSLIGTVEEDHARTEIREIVQRLFAEDSAPLSLEQRRRIVQDIEDEVMGLGPLEPLLADPKVADILVNGAKQVFVERHGKLELTDVQFNDDDHLANIIDRIVSGVGRRIDESSPMVDARLKDGSRVNAVIPRCRLMGQ